MDWKRKIRSALTRGARLPDSDVVEELAQHAQATYDSLRADGSSQAEAERQVALQIAIWADDAALLKRRAVSQSVVSAPPVDAATWRIGLLQDLRYAARLLRRQVTFTVLVVATMSLGIGATTMLFSLTYGVLMKPLPWPDAERLVLIEETRGGNRSRFNAVSNAAYLAWRDQTSTVEALAAWAPRTMTLSGVGDPERIVVTAATASLFPVLGVRPLLGSLFEEQDEIASNGPVVVISEGLWRRRFGGEPDVLGRTAQLDGQPYRIVGVLADRFRYPDRETGAWVPFHVPPPANNVLTMFNAIAKLRPGATAAQAAAEATARGRFAADTAMTTIAIFGSDGPIALAARPLEEVLTSHVRRPLLVLFAAVGLLLLTATGNVASLQLARAVTRRREMAIRSALGAGSRRVVRQLLIESVLLGLAGGAAGLILALVLHRYVPVLLPADFPRLDEVGVNAVVVGFAASAAILTSVVFGLVPALRAGRVNLIESLTEDRTALIGARRSSVATARTVIMAGQVAIACILLVGASLLGRSFVALITADRGFNPADLLTARVSLPASSYSPERRHAIVRQVLDRLSARPGVTDAAFTSELPLTPGGSTSAFTIRSRRGDGASIPVQASPRIVSPRAFQALGMRIAEGRGFDEADTETSLPVVVVNQAFARQYLGDRPLGARMPMGVGYLDGVVDATVIGVVEDIRYVTANDASQPEVYYSYRQLAGRLPVSVVTLLVRTGGDPVALGPAVRTAVREADTGVVADRMMTMQDRLLTSVARPRLYAILLGAFAVLALVVAAIGLFAVLSYSVGQRSRELAVRSALGARRMDLVRLVMAQALIVTTLGIVAGLAGSVVLSRAVGTLLYGITQYDPVTYVAVPVLLLAASLAACIAPARRAMRLDPWHVLKSG